MGDSLSKSVPFEFLEAEILQNITSQHGEAAPLDVAHETPQPPGGILFALVEGDWPENLWVGTSIITNRGLARIEELLDVGNKRTRRFLSVEPQWEPLDLHRWLPHLHWLINGGESGPQAKDFHVEWAADLLRQCRRYGVPYFLKQLGSNVLAKGKPVRCADSHGGDWKEWPAELRVREVPVIAKNGM